MSKEKLYSIDIYDIEEIELILIRWYRYDKTKMHTGICTKQYKICFDIASMSFHHCETPWLWILHLHILILWHNRASVLYFVIADINGIDSKMDKTEAIGIFLICTRHLLILIDIDNIELISFSLKKTLLLLYLALPLFTLVSISTILMKSYRYWFVYVFNWSCSNLMSISSYNIITHTRHLHQAYRYFLSISTITLWYHFTIVN